MLTMNYRDNPKGFCDRVTELIAQSDNRWQNVWKTAIIKLFESSDYSIAAVNSLLKVIEKAFKERTYPVRAQAFECWQVFIRKVNEHFTFGGTEKLSNVILIPLCASNHSNKIVLDVKLNTWLTLLEMEHLGESIPREKAIPNLLKILYGPHSLPTASSFDDLVELSSKLYFIIIRKYLKYEDELILSYLEKAISKASLNEKTQEVGKKIWNNILEFMHEIKWPSVKFYQLMRTFENLLSNVNENSCYIGTLLSSLICDFDSYPVDNLLPHLSLITRCLFSIQTESTMTYLLRFLIKRCYKKEILLFDEINTTLTDFPEEYESKLRRHWTAVAMCFCKWNKNRSDCEVCDWVLLFPVEHLYDKWDDTVQNNLQTCIENVTGLADPDVLARTLSRKLIVFINNLDNLPVSFLNAATCFCRIILQKLKLSDVAAVKELLLTIYQKKPTQPPMDVAYKTFTLKFLICVIYFLENYADYGDDFLPILRKYRHLIDSDKDSKEYPIKQLLAKYLNSKEEDTENVVPLLTTNIGANKLNNDNTTTPGKMKSRASFINRLASAEKRTSEVPFPTRIANSIKSLNISTPEHNDVNVEFVPILPKLKNSPVTEHQIEVAKKKSYIPTLYEDLSQSQSQSLSEPVSTVPLTKLSVSAICPEIIEENAILPSTYPDSTEEVPASFNFRNFLLKDKSSHNFSSKKSLFNNHIDVNCVESPSTASENEKKSRCTDSIIFSDDNVVSDEPSDADETPRPKRKSLRIEGKTVKPPSKRPKVNRKTLVQESTPNEEIIDNITSKTKARKSTQQNSKDHVDNNVEIINLSDTESQNIFVPNEVTSVTVSRQSLLQMKSAVNVLSTRRRSLRAKNANIPPPRSPSSLRKRKSISKPEAGGKKAVLPHIEDVPINYDKLEAVPLVAEELNEECSISAGTAYQSEVSDIAIQRDSPKVVNVNETSQLTNSVIIIEEKSQEVFTIDSCTQYQQDEKVHETQFPDMETSVHADEFTCIENIKTQNESFKDNSELIYRAQNVTWSPESRCDSSFILQMSELDKTSPCGSTEEKEIMSETTTITNEGEQNKENKEVNKVVEEEASKVDKVKNGTESIVDESTYEIEPSILAKSSRTSNNRISQMLELALSSQNILSKAKIGLGSNNRHSVVGTFPVTANINGTPSRTVNGIRTTTNSRTLKMLRVNGHVETSIKPSSIQRVPLLVPEKTEKFKYTPKKCLSPGILKRTNTNDSLSPKSPKTVNFSEQLTDTREYLVGENYSSSWLESDEQSDNLISEDEASSQDTLFPILHHCIDDIKCIADRLNLNKQQLDTFRRMGIQTIGQLASASTIVGKSIPVGDNRIQRLRNALKAYYNDRKLKGFRTPSVRRKILYNKKLINPLEVSSIIEILDDAEESKPKTAATESEYIEKSIKITISKCSDPVRSPCKNAVCVTSPERVVDVGSSSPVRLTRSQISPVKLVENSPPLRVRSQLNQSSPSKVNESISLSPTKRSSFSKTCRGVIAGTSAPCDNSSPSFPVKQKRNTPADIGEKKARRDPETQADGEKHSTRSHFNEDADFICTGDGIILNSSTTLYSRFAQSVMCPRIPTDQEQTNSAKISSPEVVINKCGDYLEKNEVEVANSKNNSLVELHSVSIFSQDVTKEAKGENISSLIGESILPIEYKTIPATKERSHSPVDSSSTKGTSNLNGISGVFTRVMRSLLKPHVGDLVIQYWPPNEETSRFHFLEAMRHVKIGIENLRASGKTDDEINNEAKDLMCELERLCEKKVL